jgi:hypothetical protein
MKLSGKSTDEKMNSGFKSMKGCFKYPENGKNVIPKENFG